MDFDSTDVKHSVDMDYLVFGSAHMTFALPYINLLQIVDCPICVALPEMPPHVRGALDYMGKPILMFDMRKIIGVATVAAEISAISEALMARKQDHLNWIGKLKDCVYSDKEIAVETNPHKCAFGKWYDSFSSDSTSLNTYLKKFDTPHKAIHGLAVTARELVQKGQKQKAKDLIREAEGNELEYLVKLFDGFERQIKQYTYEYAIVVRSNGQTVALAVDSLKFFDKFDELIDKLPPSIEQAACGVIDAIGRKEIDNAMHDILVLNCDTLHLAHAVTLPGSKPPVSLRLASA